MKKSLASFVFPAVCLVVSAISAFHFLRIEVGFGMSSARYVGIPDRHDQPACSIAIGGNKLSCEFAGAVAR